MSQQQMTVWILSQPSQHKCSDNNSPLAYSVDWSDLICISVTFQSISKKSDWSSIIIINIYIALWNNQNKLYFHRTVANTTLAVVKTECLQSSLPHIIYVENYNQ